MCLNESPIEKILNLYPLLGTTPAPPRKNSRTNKRVNKTHKPEEAAKEGQYAQCCNSNETKEQNYERDNKSQCQQSTGASCVAETEARENTNSENDTLKDKETFKDIHEQKTPNEQGKKDRKHDRAENIEGGIQRVEDGIRELKRIMTQIKKLVGYPEKNTRSEKRSKSKQSKRTKRQVKRKPQYFRTKANESRGKLNKKGQNDRKLFVLVNGGSKKKQKSSEYYKLYFYLQIMLQTWFKSQRKPMSKKGVNKMLSTLPKHMRSLIFQLRPKTRNSLIIAYPIQGQSTCINDYFQNLNLGNENTNTMHPMSYEWFRFGSFARYPENAPVRPIRLSAAGFHATGNGDEVKCFSCGVTYRNWTAEDEAMDVHRRISPHCEFVCSFDANIPISQPQNESTESNVSHIETTTTRTIEHNVEIDTNLQRECCPSNTQANSEENRRLSDHGTEHQTERQSETCTNEEHHNVDHPQQNGQNNDPQAVSPMVVERLDPLGINFQKPKYPSYAVLATRIRTYENWPESLTQTPKEMALAGFLYIGELDYCRCFFCGGGLRHWEAGDDPWVEHARWFPKCYFLRQNKGDAFVTIIQQAEKQAKKSKTEIETSCNHSNHIASATEVQCTNNTDIRQMNGHNLSNATTSDITQNSNQSEDELNLPSAQSVIQMGYTKEQVKQAISIIKKTQNGRPMTGSDILTTIFAIENGEICLGLGDTNEEDEVLEENKRLKAQKLCRICKDEDANIAFLPCGHLLCCGDCAPAMRYCPSCHEYVRGTVKTWLV